RISANERTKISTIIHSRAAQEIDCDSLGGASSPEDYLTRVAEVAKLLPQVTESYKAVDADLAMKKEKYKDRPDLLRIIRAIEQLIELDKKGIVKLNLVVKKSKR